jgi:hypothetical protein
MFTNSSPGQKPVAAHASAPATALAAKPPAGAPASAGARPVAAAPAGATDARHAHCIAERAYFIAQQRHFIGGDPIQDWLQAEKAVGRPPSAQHLANCTR